MVGPELELRSGAKGRKEYQKLSINSGRWHIDETTSMVRACVRVVTSMVRACAPGARGRGRGWHR